MAREAKREENEAKARYTELMKQINQIAEPDEVVRYLDENGHKVTVKLVRSSNDKVDFKGLSSAISNEKLREIGHIEVTVAEMEQAALYGIIDVDIVDRFVIRGYRAPHFVVVKDA